uniref:Uncharacterized protein n=1 Tax=Anguilla anguilla TaxID=7936 RepID=A0A0E9WNS9_ANGAN
MVGRSGFGVADSGSVFRRHFQLGATPSHTKISNTHTHTHRQCACSSPKQRDALLNRCTANHASFPELTSYSYLRPFQAQPA